MSISDAAAFVKDVVDESAPGDIAHVPDAEMTLIDNLMQAWTGVTLKNLVVVRRLCATP